VQLLVSQGPKLIDFTIKAGMPADEARALIKKNWTLAGEPTKQFSDTIAKDAVIDALGADGKTLLGQASYGEKQPVALVVSAGKLPAVAGKPYDEAARALDAVGVTAEQGELQNSHTVPKGSVIAIATKGPISPGDTVTLTISKGPEEVTVPDVVGKTWAEAKKLLLDAGFQLNYNKFADVGPNAFTVSKTNPAGGSTALWGSTIKVNFQSSF
jgi:serine/threonine-protein kinase